MSKESVKSRNKKSGTKSANGRRTSNKKHRGRRTGNRKKNTGRNIIGKIITLLQLVASIIFLAIVGKSGMVPTKYMAVAGVVLLLLFGINFALQFLHGVGKYVGMIFSLLIMIVLLIGGRYIVKGTKVIEEVGGATYKVDNMIVAVKESDAAESIEDAKEYKFGYQPTMDQENTQKMIDDIESTLGQDITLVEEESMTELANALLEGDIDAAIYNQAYTSLIEDSIEDYEDQVRVIYEFGIKTEIEQEETDVTQPFNVYVSGIDVEGEISTTSRSDVNIIMTVNPQTKKILLTSTPRDYYVTIPNVSGDARDKLTHAGIYGVDASVATLENLYGIDISYYARVNFTSVIAIVDALGGVDVNSDYDFTASNGGQHITEGVNHMDGETALAFARERYSFSDGDNQRGRNQEALIEAIINKAMSPAILTSADQILASVGGYVETNMTSDEIKKFVNMQLSDGSGWSIESVAATGIGDNQACFSSGSQELYVMWPDEAVVADLSQKIQGVIGEK